MHSTAQHSTAQHNRRVLVRPPWWLLVGLTSSLHAVAADRAITYSIEDFCGVASSCSAPSNLTWANNQANKVAGVFQDWIDSGYWDEVDSYEDASVTSKWFSDPSVQSSGHAAYDYGGVHGVDGAAVAFISTHGSSKCQSGSAPVHNVSFWMGRKVTSSEECTIATQDDGGTSGSNGDIQLGDPEDSGVNQVFIVDACQSAQHCAYASSDPGWGQPGDTTAVDGSDFLIWLGFHGNSRDSYGQVGKAKNYVAASRLNSIGDNWLDYRYASSSMFWSGDQCPAYLVWGSSSSVRQGFASYGGLDDRYSTGSHNDITYVGVCNCDPSGANELLTDCQ